MYRERHLLNSYLFYLTFIVLLFVFYLADKEMNLSWLFVCHDVFIPVAAMMP